MFDEHTFMNKGRANIFLLVGSTNSTSTMLLVASALLLKRQHLTELEGYSFNYYIFEILGFRTLAAMLKIQDSLG